MKRGSADFCLAPNCIRPAVEVVRCFMNADDARGCEDNRPIASHVFIRAFALLVVLVVLPVYADAQSGLKKVRLALPTKSASFLAFYVAYHKGFYKDEGIELEPIIMQPARASC